MMSYHINTGLSKDIFFTFIFTVTQLKSLSYR